MQNIRGATDAEDIELSLIETHVAQCQTGKHTRQEDKYGDKDDKNDILRSMWVKTRGSAFRSGDCRAVTAQETLSMLCS